MGVRFLFVCLLVLTNAVPAFANEGDFIFDLDVGTKYRTEPRSRQVIDVADGTKVGTDGDTLYYGGTLSLGKRINSNPILPDFFGDDAVLRLELAGYTAENERHTSIEHDVANNSWLNIDGTVDIGTNFMSAVYTPKYQSSQYRAGIFWAGAENNDSILIPEIGVIFQSMDSEYTMRGKYANGNTRLLMDHDMQSAAGGLYIGSQVNIYKDNAFTFSVTPSLEALYAYSELKARQDPDKLTGGMETMSLKDDECHFILTPAFSADLSYTLGNVDLGLGVSAAYLYGAPYMDLQSGVGDAVELNTSSETYELGALFKVSIPF